MSHLTHILKLPVNSSKLYNQSEKLGGSFGTQSLRTELLGTELLSAERALGTAGAGSCGTSCCTCSPAGTVGFSGCCAPFLSSELRQEKNFRIRFFISMSNLFREESSRTAVAVFHFLYP